MSASVPCTTQHILPPLCCCQPAAELLHVLGSAANSLARKAFGLPSAGMELVFAVCRLPGIPALTAGQLLSASCSVLSTSQPALPPALISAALQAIDITVCGCSRQSLCLHALSHCARLRFQQSSPCPRLGLHCKTVGSHSRCCGSTLLGPSAASHDLAHLCGCVAGPQVPMPSAAWWAAPCA